MKTRLPTVGILIPCYNYARFLEQCVRSVQTQVGVVIRIVVIDDASTDDSAQIAARLAREDSRIQLISLPKNLGMIPAVNVGIRKIEGDYFVKLDADDMLAAGSLARAVSLLEEFPNIGFVYGWPRHFTGEFPRCASTGHHRWTMGTAVEWLVTRGVPNRTIWSGSDWLELRYRRARNCIRQPEAVIRCSTLRSVGEYNPKLPHTSDLEMWLRLAAISDVGRINLTDQGYYRVHADSMQHTVNSGLLTDLVGRRGAFLSEPLAPWSRQSGGESFEDIVRKELAIQAVEGACAAFDREPVDGVLIDKLVEFGVSTFPTVITLPQWRMLGRRRRSRWSGRWSPAALTASAIRSSKNEFQYLRWMRTGA